MGRPISKKKIKIHLSIDGSNEVFDTEETISYKDLMSLKAKPRYYKDTKNRFYFIQTDYYLFF